MEETAEEKLTLDLEMPTVHVLKCWPEYFNAIWQGTKNCEIRKNDRGFQAFDFLLLRAYDPGSKSYLYEMMVVQVEQVDASVPGLQPGYVVLAIHKVLGPFGEVVAQRAEASFKDAYLKAKC
jgi:hypothetical protein